LGLPCHEALGLRNIFALFDSSTAYTMVLLGGPLGLSLAPYIFKNPGLHKALKPFANAFVNAAGYRKVGLRYDDLRESLQVQNLLF
jgi:hypothetical protein